MQAVTETVWLIFFNDELLIRKNSENLFLDAAEIQSFYSDLNPALSLGYFDNRQVHCAECKFLPSIDKDTFTWVAVRKIFESIDSPKIQLLSRALSLLFWKTNNQFCGKCGNDMKFSTKEFSSQCTACSKTVFPNLSPSIIVCIRRDDKILMARSLHFKPGVYGLIAGFVEIGETIEAAVHREVFEETQLTIKNLRYAGSQFWPFPDSLMLAFKADYAGGELCIDKSELEIAGWFNKNTLPGYPASAVSIASQLIKDFLTA